MKLRGKSGQHRSKVHQEFDGWYRSLPASPEYGGIRGVPKENRGCFLNRF
jgi:hypothetical protein